MPFALGASQQIERKRHVVFDPAFPELSGGGSAGRGMPMGEPLSSEPQRFAAEAPMNSKPGGLAAGIPASLFQRCITSSRSLS